MLCCQNYIKSKVLNYPKPQIFKMLQINEMQERVKIFYIFDLTTEEIYTSTVLWPFTLSEPTTS